jgi:opacity protein-like surface antigen
MLRGRIGYVLPDIGLPVLVYGSFGLLYNRSTAEQHQLQGTNGGLTAGMTDHLTRNVYRLVGGAGFELAPFENWTIRAEGLYSEGGLGASTYDIRHLRIETKRTRAPIVLVGVNYRF